MNKFVFGLMILASSTAMADNCCFNQDFCCEQNEGKFFVRGDLLYWTPYITGIELCFGDGAIAQSTIGDTTTLILSDEFDIDPTFDWDCGFRVAAGYETSSKFGLGVDYTHFKGKGHHRSFENGDITSQGKFNVKLDQIDLFLGYDYEFNCDFHVKPFVGVRAARIKDSVKGVITTQWTIDGDPVTGEIRYFDHGQDARAIGPLLGLEAEYNIGCGFGIYGTAAAGLLFERIHVSMDDETILGTVVDALILTDNKRHVHSIDPNADLAVGIFWNPDFFECAKLSMKLGFEHHEYFNQNHFSVFRGDMSFSGGIFALELAL